MFTDNFDQLPPARRFSRIAIGALIGLPIVITSLLIARTDLFTRGQMVDLPDFEKKILAEIEQNGFQIRPKRSSSFGSPPIIVPKVDWDSKSGFYTVTKLEIHNDSCEDILPSLLKLKNLKKISAPRLPREQVLALQNAMPSVKITKF